MFLTNGFGLGGRGILPTLESEVKRPAAMVAMGDTTLVENAERVQGYVDMREGFTAVKFNYRSPAQERRHGGKFNVLYCDGHVAAHSMMQLYDPQNDDVRAMWNKDGLPHR